SLYRVKLPAAQTDRRCARSHQRAAAFIGLPRAMTDLLRDSEPLIRPAARTIGAVDMAVGLAGGALAIMALPELAIAGGVLEILTVSGALTSGVVQVGLGLVEFFNGIAINQEAKNLTYGLTSPVVAMIAGNLSLTGDPRL